MVHVQDILRSAGFCPLVRADLKYFRGKTAGIVVIQDAARGKRFNVNQFQYQVLRDMNGERDLDMLAGIANKRWSSTTRAQIEELTVQFAAMGLLANIPSAESTPPPSRPALSVINGGQAPTAGQIPAASTPEPIPALDVNFDGDGDDGLGGETYVDPEAKKIAGILGSLGPSNARDAGDDFAREESTQVTLGTPPPPQPVPAPPLRPTPMPLRPSQAFAATMPAMPQAIPISAPPPVTPSEKIGAPSAAVPVPAEPPAAPPPAAAAAQPAYDIVKPPWYRRKAPRRLLYVGILVSVVIALALIQYPLHITEACFLRPESQVVVRAPVDGILIEIMVDEGQSVTKGTPIARFDDRTLSHEMQRARAEYDRLNATLQKMKAGSRPEEIKQAQALVAQRAQDAAFAAREVKRINKLYRSGDASQVEREERRRDHSVKLGALSEAKAQLKLVKAGFRSEEVSIADADLRKAKADVDFYEKQIAMLTIKAPIDGKVLTPRFRERLNERIAAGDSIVQIGDASTLRVEILIPERDADVLAVGQPVTVKVHSLPLTPFNGKLAFLAPAIEEKDGQRFIRADAIIDNPKGLLQPRMSGYAEIDTGEMSLLNRISRRLIRWVRVRFLI